MKLDKNTLDTGAHLIVVQDEKTIVYSNKHSIGLSADNDELARKIDEAIDNWMRERMSDRRIHIGIQ